MGTEQYPCQACGAVVTRPVARGQRPKWCADCRNKGRPRNCAVCEARFQATTSATRYCSRPCYFLARFGPPSSPVPATHPSRRAPRERPGPSVRVFITDCAVCGRCFASPYTIATCGPECREVKRLSDKREAKHRRRARKRGAFVAPVFRLTIYRRDNWRCHLCSKPVRRDVVAPHPLSATLDHVIPLARGGTHEPANVRTAHYLCNARKSDRGGGEQLMLVG